MDYFNAKGTAHAYWLVVIFGISSLCGTFFLERRSSDDTETVLIHGTEDYESLEGNRSPEPPLRYRPTLVVEEPESSSSAVVPTTTTEPPTTTATSTLGLQPTVPTTESAPDQPTTSGQPPAPPESTASSAQTAPQPTSAAEPPSSASAEPVSSASDEVWDAFNKASTSFTRAPERKGIAVGQTVSDPNGAELTLISDAEDSRHRYSSFESFNADETVLYLDKGEKMFIDVATGKEIGWEPIKGLSFWSNTDPEILIGVVENKVVRWNAREGRVESSVELVGWDDLNFQTRGGISLNDRVVVKAKDDKGVWHAIPVDTLQATIGAPIDFASVGAGYYDRVGEDKSRSATVTPTGKHIMVGAYVDGEYQRRIFLDWDTREVVSATKPNDHTECPGSHGDMVIDANGGDVFVGVCKGGGESWSDAYAGNLVEFVVATGEYRNLGVEGFSHCSGRAVRRPGWVYCSGNGSGIGIIAVRLADGRVEYYADPRNKKTGYGAETQISPSPSGRLGVFATSNDGTFPKGQVYLLDVRHLAD